MGDKVEVQVLVEGGKASGGPPIGPAIGPTGIPTKDVVDEINRKTQEFKGLKVPVKVIADPETKTFEVIIETPMTSALLIKEAGIQKGSGEPTTNFVGNVTFEQVKKIARMKKDKLNALTFKTQVKTVVGTAYSCGITIDGKPAKQVLQEIEEGLYDEQLKEDED